MPSCIAVGAAWGWKTWNASERERRDFERCAVLRSFVGKPDLPCAFLPQDRAQAAVQPPGPALLAEQDLVAP